MAYTTIDNSGSFMNTVLYAGNSPSTQSITGVGFQPDLVWIKSRSSTEWHNIVDAVRGNTSNIYSNAINAADTASRVTAFGADGFSLGAIDGVNNGADNFVSWNWKANGAGSAAYHDGAILYSTLSVNTTSRFSISTYNGSGSAGATFGHGLGVVPNMVVIKRTGTNDDWQVYHSANTSAPETDYLVLNTNAATTDALDRWNDTAPTTTLVTLGDADAVNASGNGYVAYCFADVAGYSKFNSYTGNGDADGTFIYTGFRPAFVIIKAASVQNWVMFDSKRLGYNDYNKNLHPNEPAAEEVLAFDILSNGFKPRTTDGKINTSSVNYIYMAFAEAPFVNSSGVPCNAR